MQADGAKDHRVADGVRGGIGELAPARNKQYVSLTDTDEQDRWRPESKPVAFTWIVPVHGVERDPLRGPRVVIGPARQAVQLRPHVASRLTTLVVDLPERRSHAHGQIFPRATDTRAGNDGVGSDSMTR